MDLIKIAEEAFATGKQHPSFKAGDTVTVELQKKHLLLANSILHSKQVTRLQ